MSTPTITSPEIMAQAADLVGDELQQLQDMASAMVLFLDSPDALSWTLPLARQSQELQ